MYVCVCACISIVCYQTHEWLGVYPITLGAASAELRFALNAEISCHTVLNPFIGNSVHYPCHCLSA